MALTPERIAIPDYSQGGEGQIVLGLLGKLPERDKTCVEVGAADGIYLSNTRHLVECFGYNATLLEADAALFGALRRNALTGSRLIQLEVGWGEEDSLNAQGLPTRTDFMSIDIDGNDYHVWKAMTACRPKIVCIEYNPTIPNEVAFVQPRDPAVRQGSSLLALTELASEKGYELAAVTTFNAFFVAAEFFPAMGIADNKVSTLRPFPPLVTYLFTGYDGQVFLSGAKRIPWHPVRFSERRVQVMPKLLRGYQRTRFQEFAFKAWNRLHSMWSEKE